MQSDTANHIISHLEVTWLSKLQQPYRLTIAKAYKNCNSVPFSFSLFSPYQLLKHADWSARTEDPHKNQLQYKVGI